MNIQQLSDRISVLEMETRDQMNARLADNEEAAKRTVEEIAAAPVTTITNADFQRAVAAAVKQEMGKVMRQSDRQQPDR
jgi:hypothetical protein